MQCLLFVFPCPVRDPHLFLASPRVFPDIVLWDWDGTLVDTGLICWKAYNLLMADLGWPTLSFEAYRQGLHQSLRQTLEHRLTPEAFERARQTYQFLIQTLSEEVTLRPFVSEGIRLLHQKGIKMGIVSNKEHHSLQEEVAASGLQPYFQVCIGSGYAAEDKPSPQPIWAALETLGPKQIFHPQQVWFIGDSRVDIEAATAALCFPVFVGDTSFKTLSGLRQAFWHAGAPEDVVRHCLALRG